MTSNDVPLIEVLKHVDMQQIDDRPFIKTGALGILFIEDGETEESYLKRLEEKNINAVRSIKSGFEAQEAAKHLKFNPYENYGHERQNMIDFVSYVIDNIRQLESQLKTTDMDFSIDPNFSASEMRYFSNSLAQVNTLISDSRHIINSSFQGVDRSIKEPSRKDILLEKCYSELSKNDKVEAWDLGLVRGDFKE